MTESNGKRKMLFLNVHHASVGALIWENILIGIRI